MRINCWEAIIQVLSIENYHCLEGANGVIARYGFDSSAKYWHQSVWHNIPLLWFGMSYLFDKYYAYFKLCWIVFLNYMATMKGHFYQLFVWVK